MFASWTTDRRVPDIQLEYQLDFGSGGKINSSNGLIAAHQTSDRSAAPNKANNTALFENLNVRKNYVEKDGIRHPRDFFCELYYKYLSRSI